MVKKLPKLFVKSAEQQCSRSVETNFDHVFSTFKRHYQLVPLEVFADHPYKTLISTLLSSRTRDELTLKISENLFEIAQNVKILNDLNVSEIEKLIYPVGFYKTKAKHLHDLAGLILTRYDGVVPQTREELMKLPGVGRKTANLVLNRAFGIPAIAVDVHVHRISNLLGWVNTKTPEKTEVELMRILPVSYWPDLNRLFVSIGRQFRSIKKLEEFLRENKLL
jgi:endonuclease-3